MKKIKSILCLSLALLLILLCGCSNPERIEQNEQIEQKEGFIKMTDLAIHKNEHVSKNVINGDNAVLFSTFYDKKNDKTEFRLVVYDMLNDKLIADKLVTEDANIEDDYTVEFIDEKSIALCDNWEKTAVIYDLRLNKLREDNSYKAHSEIDYTDLLEKAKKNCPYVSDEFVIFDSFVMNNKGSTRAIILNDQPENIFIEDYSFDIEVAAYFADKIAYSEENRDTYSVSIKDYSKKKVINTASFKFDKPSPDDFSRVPYGVAISEKYLIVPYNNTKGTLEGCYYWNYTVNPTSTPFEALTLNADNIKKYIESKKKEVEDKYEIEFVINPDTINDDRPLTKEDNDLIIYQSIIFIDDILSYFPDGMLKEIYDYEDGFDTLRMYLCGTIEDENIGAFANNLNGVNYVVFQTRLLSSDYIPHELMHSMEYRIWRMIGDEHDEKLLALNPKGFEYMGTDTYFSGEYDSDDYQNSEKYFARDYGMTDQLEDKAVIFEYLFCYGIGDMKIDWKKSDPVYKKAKILCKAIRDAYPSVQQADSVVWEKYLNE